MKPIVKQILISSVSAIVGGLIVFGGMKLSAPKTYSQAFPKKNQLFSNSDPIFNDEFFGPNDPFENLKNMRDQLEKNFQDSRESNLTLKSSFDVTDISKREDNDYVYLDIKVPDLNSTTINTKIENGYITITGTEEKKSESNRGEDDEKMSAQSFFKSSFSRTFPIPEKVDQNKMQMVSEKDKVILKFPKMTT